MTALSDEALAGQLMDAMREEAAVRGLDPLFLSVLVIVRDNRPSIEMWLAERRFSPPGPISPQM